MLLTRKSTAWVLVGLQTIFSIFFTKYLTDLFGSNSVQFLDAPTWYKTLILMNFGLAVILALSALWKFQITAILLLFAIHFICPILFFTDLTRNPYFTQIILLNIWIAFIWIAWFWDGFSDRKFVFPKTPLDMPILIFTAVALASWFLSFFTHPKSFHPAMLSEGLKMSLFLIVNCIAVFYIAASIDDKWRGKFIWATFIVGAFAAVYGLMQFYGLERIWQKTLTPFANRPVSTFGNPNFLSSYLMLIVPLVISSLLTTKKVSSFVLSSAILISLVTGLIATMTRSSWVGLLLALSVLPFAGSIRELLKKHSTKIGIIVIILCGTVLFWPKSKLGGYENPMQRILEIKNVKNEGGYGPWHQRMLIWSCCWNMTKDHFLFGKGWGQLELFYPYYQGKALWNDIFRGYRTHANNAHNEVLEVWSQTGFIGMGIYAWMWVVLVFYGIKLSKQRAATNPEKSILAWALTAASLGMLTDNFFGNVSVHFAVPGFLFWWQVGLLFGLSRSENISQPNKIEWRIIPVENNLQKYLLVIGSSFMIAVCIWNFRREFQEIYYFRGFKITKSSNLLEPAKQELEKAWMWYPREVNLNYELANTYARLSHQSLQMGLNPQADAWRKKAIWAYMESLRSNCGYDEIFFNLGAILGNMPENNTSEMSVETPRGLTVTEHFGETGGSIYNYSRALAINPLSQDTYNLLGNVFFQNLSQYKEQALQLFNQAVIFFPEGKDFWVNLAYLHIQNKNYPEAHAALEKAMNIDPFYELTRRNLRAFILQAKRTNDPLAEADAILPQINPLIQSKSWIQLRAAVDRLVKILPGNFQLRFILANVCFELKEWERAEKEYLAALKMEPWNTTLLNNLTLAYRAQNKIAEAKKTCERVLRMKPNDEQAKIQMQQISSIEQK